MTERVWAIGGAMLALVAGAGLAAQPSHWVIEFALSSLNFEVSGSVAGVEIMLKL